MVKLWSPYSYGVKGIKGEALEALDAPLLDEVSFDESTMSATGLLATADRDRVGDIFEVSGLDLSDHKRNPVALIDHGRWWPLPIGKCEDPDGNYTVWIDGSDCYQTTFFSQSSKIAEQVFALHCEKILRGNSIHYQIIDFRKLPPDPARGFPGGKHLLKTKLVEASWCGIPVNQDAVMATLSRDKICGKSLAPEIKSMLLPYIQEKTWVTIPVSVGGMEKKNVNVDVKGRDNGEFDQMVCPKCKATFTAGEFDRNGERCPKCGNYYCEFKKDVNMSEADTKGIPQGSVDEPADRPNEQEVPVESKSESDGAPLGSSLLRSLSGAVRELTDHHEKELAPCENDKVKKAMGKHLEALKAMCAKMEELHEAEYGNGEKSEDGDNDGDDHVEEPEDGKDMEEGDDVKSLLNTLIESKNLSREQKAILKFIGKSLQPLKPVEAEMQLTAAEEKELANLERQIHRRVEMLNKIMGGK